MQHPAMKNSPIVVNNYNNSTAVHNSSPTRHAAPRAIDLSGSINADVARYCEAIGVDPKAQGAIKSQESTQGNQGCHESGGRTPRVLPRLRKPESFHRRSVLINFRLSAWRSSAQQQHAQRI